MYDLFDDKDDGTTGHAVLALNKEDGGNRKFILVEQYFLNYNLKIKEFQEEVLEEENF